MFLETWVVLRLYEHAVDPRELAVHVCSPNPWPKNKKDEKWQEGCCCYSHGYSRWSLLYLSFLFSGLWLVAWGSPTSIRTVCLSLDHQLECFTHPKCTELCLLQYVDAPWSSQVDIKIDGHRRVWSEHCQTILFGIDEWWYRLKPLAPKKLCSE